jgi:serine/threonine protein kinase
MSNFPDFSSHRYQVIRELGRNREGGRVSYLAQHLEDSTEVVIKQFRFAQDSASWEGFKAYEREIAILQGIQHPRIPRYLNSFETSDGFCMVQEYKEAPTLASQKIWEPKIIQKILISVLQILADLQQHTPIIIHRDIKPENILVDANRQAYLIDFGLARVNSQDIALSSVMAGTPGFMPPEELFNRPLTAASDLYSLGATAIALLTNTPPAKVSELIDENYCFKFQHLVSELNPDFIQWLQKMVAPNYTDRHQNAAIALEALKAIDITGLPSRPSLNIKQQRIAQLCGLIAVFAVGFYPRLQRAATNIVSNDSPAPVEINSTSGQQWFNQIKSRCNSVEVVTAMNSNPYPQTPEGAGYGASCYALAGKIDLADRTIQSLPDGSRAFAAGVVFNIGHPVADAGDDKSAGPIMDLVVKYWPANYMATYHAGMSHYILGEYPQATQQLQAFLQVYQQPDGWTAKARSALTRMEQGIPADESFVVRD